jgi:hypothetical protein
MVTVVSVIDPSNTMKIWRPAHVAGTSNDRL